jgi:molecular chaperone HtpG
MLEDMAKKEPEKYAAFWKEFGQVLKEGPAEDYSSKDKIANLLRFASTHVDSEEQTVSLHDYMSRMKENQNKIYYLIADNYVAAKNSPLLELFRKKGIEVLLMVDRVDEWLTAHLTEYEGKTLQSIAKGKLDLDEKEAEAEQEELKKEEENFASVLKQMEEALGEKVKSVRLTNRLTDSPSCVVFDENEMSGHLQRLMKAAGQAVPAAKPILELNAEHRLVIKLKEEQDDTRFAQWANILLAQALLAEGEQLEDPAGFVKQLNELL